MGLRCLALIPQDHTERYTSSHIAHTMRRTMDYDRSRMPARLCHRKAGLHIADLEVSAVMEHALMLSVELQEVRGWLNVVRVCNVIRVVHGSKDGGSELDARAVHDGPIDWSIKADDRPWSEVRGCEELLASRTESPGEGQRSPRPGQCASST